MKGFWLNSYGRKNINMLDWFIAIVCVLIAVGAIWISIGLSIANAAPYAVPAFRDVVHGLAFKWKTNEIVIANTFISYLAVLFCIFGIVFLVVKGKKERIPGVVAIFIAAVGLVIFASLLFEFVAGESARSIHPVWAYGLIFFVVALVACIGYAARMTFTEYEIEFASESAVEEEKKAEPVKEEKPEPAPVVEEKPEPSPVGEEEPEEEEEIEEPEASEPIPGNFKDLGARRRRIPFESKIKTCSKETRAHYKEIAEAIRQYKVSDRLSIPGETVSYKRQRLVFITLAGKTLKVHFALEPKEYENSTIPVKDASELKKYDQTPAYLKVKSDLACRRAIGLARKVMSEHNVPKR